jgi:rubrerythrin
LPPTWGRFPYPKKDLENPARSQNGAAWAALAARKKESIVMEEKYRTDKNLKEAFAGEAMANRKYLYFAKQARRLGNNQIAELFEEIAHQETAHAFSHLELIYEPNSLTVGKLLELAIEGELYETNHMYPEFERIAREEGEMEAVNEFIEQGAESRDHANIFMQAAKRFNALGKVEKIHAKRYQDALLILEEGPACSLTPQSEDSTQHLKASA